ncbi:MAG: hypothetical protein ABI977_33335 [Acidobacteriota bacterium]
MNYSKSQNISLQPNYSWSQRYKLWRNNSSYKMFEVGKKISQFSFSCTRILTPFLLSLLLFFSLNCRQIEKEASTSVAREKISSVEKQENDILDSTANRKLFEEMKKLWFSKKPSHYRVHFTFTCDCKYRTDQLRDVSVHDRIIKERNSNVLTVEVNNEKVIDIRKEDGKSALVGEYHSTSTLSSVTEYLWRIGEDDKDGNNLLSEPVGFLWESAEKAFQNKATKVFSITYDGHLGFIKRINFISEIPDDQFKAEINNFTVLN